MRKKLEAFILTVAGITVALAILGIIAHHTLHDAHFVY